MVSIGVPSSFKLPYCNKLIASLGKRFSILIFNLFCQLLGNSRLTRAGSKEKEGNLATFYLFVRGNKV